MVDEFEISMGVSKTEWTVTMDALKLHCVCTTCPTYALALRNKMQSYLNQGYETSQSDHIPFVGTQFCFSGKSDHIKEDKGCICATCQVHVQMKLEKDCFCKKGSEHYQRGVPDEGEVLADWWTA
ncbi:MAG: DUF2769 domain-containing protein [Candidatus Hodarchaeota archaeon]